MKKEYETPRAEKIVFDYTESVIACHSDHNPCQGCDVIRTEDNNSRNVSNNSISDANRDLGNPYHKCSCSNYWGN